MRKKLLLVLLILLAVGAYVGWNFRNILIGEAVSKDAVVFIPTGSNYDTALERIKSCNCFKDFDHLKQVAEWKKYPDLVKPGRYELTKGMSNQEVIHKLRIGEQDPVRVTFNNVRTLQQLAGKVSRYFESDSLNFLEYFMKREVHQKYGFNSAQFSTLFIPNTYQFIWTNTPEDFCKRMASEYKKFWNEERKKKARALGLSQSEVSTLASIVEEETKKNDEKPIVAGVYLNRLKKNMLLQADPTVVFAANDFTIRRVLNKHKAIDSPYNTYKYKGLPPGPIRFPEISSLDAVLNRNKHNYLYFCAKEDFSGYHSFATNYNDHLKNARRYQAALNKRNIYQ